MAGTNVAKLPKKYAMLHFITPLPVFDLANAQPCNKEVCHLASILRKVSRPLEGFTIWRSEGLRQISGVRSFAVRFSVEPSKPGESPKVTVRLTLSPVLGRMRVAWRSYNQYSISRPYTCCFSEDLTFGRNKRRDLMGTVAPLVVELIREFS